MPMPRRSKKKQARLAFAPKTDAASAGDGSGNEETSDRQARLSYGHPSMAEVRSQGSRIGGAEPSKRHRPLQQYLEVQIRTPKKAERKEQPQPVVSDSSDDDIVVLSSHKRKRPTLPAIAEPEDMDMDMDMETPRARRLKRKADNNPIVLSDSDEPLVSSPVKRLRRGPKRDSEPSDSDKPLVPSPVKRLQRGSKTQSPQTPGAHHNKDQDQEEIDEDAKDLQDSVVKNSRTRGHIAGSAKDQRQKHLEALRRKRAGIKEDSDSDATARGDTSATELSDDDGDRQFNGDEDLDQYDDDFVLDDDATALGVPTELPFEFTRHAYKKLKEYFEDVVCWMVHNSIDPAFPRSDPMYEMAFNKLEDEVKGRTGSQFMSSVWDVAFRRALLARPGLEIAAYPTDMGHSCDACKRSGHPASSDLRFSGKPYSLETLEPLSEDSETSATSGGDESSDEEEKGMDRDRDGHILPEDGRSFYLGKTCKANAQSAHTLYHWRYHLNEWVVDHLQRMGHMDDDEVLRRNKMKQKHKTRNAIEVIKTMKENNEIEKLWRDFHTNLKVAREEQNHPARTGRF
ncbi:unnamed protein product [Penicillium manginii]